MTVWINPDDLAMMKEWPPGFVDYSRTFCSKSFPGSMRRCAPPKLLQPFVPTTPITVEFITDRVFLVVMLVVLLGGIKLGCLGDFGDNGTLERLALFQRLL